MTAGVNRAFIFAKRDTIYAKLYPDSLVLQNVLGDTTWMRELVPLSTSGQNAWFKRNAVAPHSGWLSPATATDTLSLSKALWIGGERAGTNLYVNAGTSPTGGAGLYMIDTLAETSAAEGAFIFRTYATGTPSGRRFGVTSNLSGTYTGSGGTYALSAGNGLGGTSIGYLHSIVTGNLGVRGSSGGLRTVGTNIGLYGEAYLGNVNIAVVGNGNTQLQDSVVTVGVAGYAFTKDPIASSDYVTRIGGYFGFYGTTTDVLQNWHESALIADVSGRRSPIFLAQKGYGVNGSHPVFAVYYNSNIASTDSGYSPTGNTVDTLQHRLAITGIEDSLGINIVNRAFNTNRTNKGQSIDSASVGMALTANGAPYLWGVDRTGTQKWGVDSSGKLIGDAINLTSVLPKKSSLLDSLNGASPWLSEMTRSWRFDSTVTALKVGVGTTSPLSMFHVDKPSNDVISVANAAFNFIDVALNAGLIGQQLNSSPYAFILQSQNKTGGTLPLVLNPNGGNVGIGIINPSYKLHMYGSGAQRMAQQSSTASNVEWNLINSVGTWAIYNEGVASTNDLRFYNGGDRVVIKSTGSVLIGGTTTSHGGLLESFSTGAQLGLWYDASNGTQFTTGVTGNLTITPSGGTTAITGKLEPTGLVTLPAIGANLTLRAIAEGDSVYGHVILRSSDSTIVMWNGTAWKTIADTR